MINEKFDIEPKFEYTEHFPKLIDLLPEYERWSKELQKDIKRGEAVAIRCSEETERKLYDYYVRKLLKPRVHRIKIDTWEK